MPSTIAAIHNPLPDANQFARESIAMAWTEVLAFSAAAIGLFLAYKLLESFTK